MRRNTYEPTDIHTFCFFFSSRLIFCWEITMHAPHSEYIGLYMVETTITTKEASLLFPNTFFYYILVIIRHSKIKWFWNELQLHFSLDWNRMSLFREKSCELCNLLRYLWRSDSITVTFGRVEHSKCSARSIFNIRSIAGETQSEL